MLEGRQNLALAYNMGLIRVKVLSGIKFFQLALIHVSLYFDGQLLCLCVIHWIQQRVHITPLSILAVSRNNQCLRQCLESAQDMGSRGKWSWRSCSLSSSYLFLSSGPAPCHDACMCSRWWAPTGQYPYPLHSITSHTPTSGYWSWCQYLPPLSSPWCSFPYLASWPQLR